MNNYIYFHKPTACNRNRSDKITCFPVRDPAINKTESLSITKRQLTELNRSNVINIQKFAMLCYVNFHIIV